jgi:hypothetical protein
LPARGNDGGHLVNDTLTLRERRLDKSVVWISGISDPASGVADNVIAKGYRCSAKIFKIGGVVVVGDRFCCGRC